MRRVVKIILLSLCMLPSATSLVVGIIMFFSGVISIFSSFNIFSDLVYLEEFFSTVIAAIMGISGFVLALNKTSGITKKLVPFLLISSVLLSVRNIIIMLFSLIFMFAFSGSSW